jgi:hypothetical protein
MRCAAGKRQTTEADEGKALADRQKGRSKRLTKYDELAILAKAVAG